MYADIFDLDDRIKQKEKDIAVLERALRYQDSRIKKNIRNDQSGVEAEDFEKQLFLKDSLYR